MFIVSAPIATADHQHGWDSFYLDHADGTFPYRDFFVEEFMPHVERALPVPTAGRWIGGSGMGGYGALSLVLDHPALFEGVAAWEPSEYTPVDLVEMDQADYDRRFGPSWGAGRFGAARITEAYLDDSLFGRARDVEAQAFGSTKFYIRLASSGPTAAGGELLRRRMDEKALPVTFTDGMDDGPILFAACMMSQNPRYRTEACLQDVPQRNPRNSDRRSTRPRSNPLRTQGGTTNESPMEFRARRRIRGLDLVRCGADPSRNGPAVRVRTM